MSLTNAIQKLAMVNIFKEAKQREMFVGRPFYLDYERAHLLIADAWKSKVGGVPQGAFLLAFYDNEEGVSEALLLRVIKPTKLPTDNDVISSMIEFYKDTPTESRSTLDEFTRYEFSFSGLECRILGTFYLDRNERTVFGADVENFYSAHNYTVYKANGRVLELIANLRDSDSVPGGETDIRIGRVRYSSSFRFQEDSELVPVYVTPKDFLGKRTAMFGMTRTGKSNTVKKVIQATVEISNQATARLQDIDDGITADNLESFAHNGAPIYPVGQIIFDINGEYANANMQDEGTAIFEMYSDSVIRYSVLQKPGFRVMKVNFYSEILSGFELIKSRLATEPGDYVKSFLAVDLSEPEDPQDYSANTRYLRKKAAYLCCLFSAGFKAPQNFKVKFKGSPELNAMVKQDGSINPDKGLSLSEATNWFTKIWGNYNDTFFTKYAAEKGHEWADEDLKALLVFLTRKQKPGGNANVSGFRKLRDMLDLHTEASSKPFEDDIVDGVRDGNIIIVDLSQGDPEVQRLYSERVCQKIFGDAMNRFIQNKPNNFIQFYFEEAHNLFPKKDDKDLSQIYNRIAKEGAKLNLGMVYATQEVSTISSNILKNTQNWFIAHLNNDDELRELRKYYDFGDFTDGLVRFSAGSDKGFVRMKTYSNPFVVPVQIDRFSAKEE
ncbi:ATP-binding protein [Alicyclobacillus tolerans]|uniref:ATP-binding protein n=1 Tax=Alicyclobacillus tolerans TaxID=90970 RepID=UPI003B7BE2C7